MTFKVESHNHPSFVEPYQGAATGVGGIVRDILAMGARPVAVMDPLRFGAADHPDTARVLPGVVAGVGGYGNCLGLPNIGGEVVFDPCYQGNPLVNALCVGVLPVDRLQSKEAARPRQRRRAHGRQDRPRRHRRRVGAGQRHLRRDGPAAPPVGAGRRPVHREAADRVLPGAVRGGSSSSASRTSAAPGLTCALTETSASAGTGMDVQLDRVPLREASMEPHEILASESQERMLLIVEPAQARRGARHRRSCWGVLATAIGVVTDEPAGRASSQLARRRPSSTSRRAASSTTARSMPGRCGSPPT